MHRSAASAVLEDYLSRTTDPEGIPGSATPIGRHERCHGMKRFEGKNVLVTGGNSGIGLAAALAFTKEGARVVLTGRDQSTLDKAAAQLGENAIAVRNDAGSVADGIVLATMLQQRGVMLDAVFVNAGVATLAPFEAVGEEMWDAAFDTNVKGPYFLIKALVPLLNPGAAIVLNGSINAHIGMPNTTVYAASKAALISLAKTLSSELLGRGVRVNVVSPGPIATPLFGRLGLPAEQVSEVATSIQAQVPLKRFGTPDEIASAVLYLASAESAYIVGTELVADGGMSQL
jgi:NAD(P)-dependent dehydrogenase (short-subunit alcohol dehydrogenase family)